MQSLASPTVGIAHGGRVVRFTRRGAGVRAYEAAAAPPPDPTSRVHESLFETGLKVALVPERLYRFEDRRDYLTGTYPTVSRGIGVAAVAPLGALAVFEHDPRLPDGADVGHHLVQLLASAGEDLVRLGGDFALALFVGHDLWVALWRGGELVGMEGQRYRDEADAVFALASQLGRFGMDRAATRVYLGGAIAPGGALDRGLGIYFDVYYLAEAVGTLANPHLATALLLAFGQALRDQPGAPAADA